MNRIAIIGSGGSGKSTLAKELGEKLRLPVYHLDALMWKPGWELVSRDEQRRIQREVIMKDRWIIDGNYGATIDYRLEAADTVIFLDMPRSVCISSIIKRRIQYQGRTRPDMQKDCPEKLDLEFVKWVWNFPKDKKPHIEEKLAALPENKKVIILKTRKEVKAFVRKLVRTEKQLD